MTEKLDRYVFCYEEEPKEEDDKARCDTCDHFDANVCGLFKKLNEAMPECFELTEPVSKEGYCKAFCPMAGMKGIRGKAEARIKELESEKEDDSEDSEEEDDMN